MTTNVSKNSMVGGTEKKPSGVWGPCTQREEEQEVRAGERGCGQTGKGLHAKSRNLKSILKNLNSHEDLGLGESGIHELFPYLFVCFF